jgi:hypothetical protein
MPSTATGSERSTDADYAAEAHYWRNVAIYLADCHAATAYDYEAKSASKSRRSRMISILNTCVAALNKHPTKCGDHPRSEQDVMDRCNKTITRLHAVNEATK